MIYFSIWIAWFEYFNVCIRIISGLLSVKKKLRCNVIYSRLNTQVGFLFRLLLCIIKC